MVNKDSLICIGYISRPHSYKGDVQLTLDRKIVPLKRDDFLFLKIQGQFIPYKMNGIKGKQDEPISLVAAFCHFINKGRGNKKSIVITLGATRSPIDDVRYVQNTSSGATGWAIAEDLHRHGHDVSVVAGTTTVQAAFPLPLIIQADEPDEMLKECIALSNDDIQAWVHCAAVLDYLVNEPKLGKFASQQGDWDITLKEGPKHIEELKELCKDSVRIGFKLETGVKISDLVHRALAQIKNSGMNAVIANRLEDISNPNKPRAHLIDSLGEHWALQDNAAIAKAVRTFIER